MNGNDKICDTVDAKSSDRFENDETVATILSHISIPVNQGLISSTENGAFSVTYCDKDSKDSRHLKSDGLSDENTFSASLGNDSSTINQTGSLKILSPKSYDAKFMNTHLGYNSLEENNGANMELRETLDTIDVESLSPETVCSGSYSYDEPKQSNLKDQFYEDSYTLNSTGLFVQTVDEKSICNESLMSNQIPNQLVNMSKHKKCNEEDSRERRISLTEVKEPVSTESRMIVSGYLNKQSDHMGIWRQRYFVLGAYDQSELKLYRDFAQAHFFEQTEVTNGDKIFVLFYWSCNAENAQTEGFRYKPRGAFAFKLGTKMDRGDGMMISIDGLVNAFKPSRRVPVLHLAAFNIRDFQTWLRALAFAALTERLFTRCINWTDDAQSEIWCGNLGVRIFSARSNFRKSYVQIYRDSAKWTNNERVLLMVWDNEESANKMFWKPKNVYEISDASVTILKSEPCVIVLSEIISFHLAGPNPLKGAKSNRKLYLAALSHSESVKWANSLVQDPKRRRIESVLSHRPFFIKGEDFIDEYIAPEITSTLYKKVENRMGVMENGEEIVDEVCVNQDESKGSCSPLSSSSFQEVSVSNHDDSSLLYNSFNKHMQTVSSPGAKSFHTDPQEKTHENMLNLVNSALRGKKTSASHTFDQPFDDQKGSLISKGRFARLPPVNEEELENE